MSDARPHPVQTWRAPPAPPAAPRDPAAAAAAPTTARTRSRVDADERELQAVRLLLSSLRPDCAEPLLPPPPSPTLAPAMRVRDPMAGWGDTPSGLDDSGSVRAPSSDGAAALAADVLRRIAALPPDARAVCAWLREHARLLDHKHRLCLRGLYVDAGRAFAGDELLALWGRDLARQRDGAHRLGREVVIEASRAWGMAVV